MIHKTMIQKTMIQKLTSAMVLACVVAFAGAAHAATMEEIEAKLSESHKKLKSYTAKTSMHNDMDLGDGNTMKLESTGTHEWLRQGEKMLYRIDTKSHGENNFGGQKTVTDSSVSVICDGAYVYTLSDDGNQKTALKNKVDPSNTGEVRYIFENMREAYNLKVLPDANEQGHDCFVIEATLKEQNPMSPIAKNVHYFSKDMGIMIKLLMYNAKGKVVGESLTTDIAMNKDIDAGRFVFKAPPGVTVMDTSGL